MVQHTKQRTVLHRRKKQSRKQRKATQQKLPHTISSSSFITHVVFALQRAHRQDLKQPEEIQQKATHTKISKRSAATEKRPKTTGNARATTKQAHHGAHLLLLVVSAASEGW